MESSEEMRKTISDPVTIRHYLLGLIEDRVLLHLIEENLISNNEFAEMVDIAESELIEDFLDDDLNPEHTSRFLQFFLASDTRKRDLHLIKHLRTTASAEGNHPPPKAVHSTSTIVHFRYRILQGITLLLVVLVGAIGVWKNFFEKSDTDRGLELVQASLERQRPFAGRLTIQKTYAPYSETRGNSQAIIDPFIRDRAQRYLLDGAADKKDGYAHHALGLYFLVTGEIEKALRELNKAVELDPGNARFQSDTGTALLEMAKRSTYLEDGGRSLEYFNESIKHLERAIEIDPDLLEPRFVLALCLEQLTNIDGAKAAWHEYLKLDPDSLWADEARRHLKELDEKANIDIHPEELDRDFIAAYRNDDIETASRLIRENRELVRERYLPQRLAMAHTMSMPDLRSESLKVLQFCGRVELQLTGDPFARDLADYYSTASDQTLRMLGAAHRNVLAGNRNLIKQNYQAALTEFGHANRIFFDSGNIWEAHISGYFIGYILINQNKQDLGRSRLEEVERFAEKKGYLWLEATALHWIGGSYVRSKQHSLARRSYEKALGLAERIDDPYSRQRNLLELANRYSYTGQISRSLNYLYRAIYESGRNGQSQRQRYRTLAEACTILSSAGFYGLAGVYSGEAVAVADRLNDDPWRSQSRGIAAMALTHKGDLSKARIFIDEGGKIARKISDQSLSRGLIAFSEIRAGELERHAGNHEIAEQHFQEAVRYFDSVNLPLNREVARKGLLLTYLAQNKTTELDKEIKAYIDLTEEYRERIYEEDQRSGFLSTRVDVYDIATDLEFRRNNVEAAYKYAEMASSRALLDRMKRGASSEPDGPTKSEIIMSSSARPASLSEVRERMPAEVQILQFSILENKLLIWVISKDAFSLVDVNISANDLLHKVGKFREHVIAGADDEAQSNSQLERELYDILIGPVRDALVLHKQICIVPSKALFKLPFAALRSPEDRYLLSDWTIFFAPSASSFLHSSELAGQKEIFEDEKILAVGNPSFELSKFDGLPLLSDAEREAENISRLYRRADILINKNAKKSAFLNAFSRSEVVHFAGHYVPVPGLPSESFMLMAADGSKEENGKLTNRELADFRLPVTRLVVLAACQTGVEKYDNGEEMMGLVGTTLAIDAPVVIGSQWAVDSHSTSVLMRRFHFLRKRSNLSSASALRQAQLDMKSDPSGAFVSPRFWAAFSVFGGYAKF